MGLRSSLLHQLPINKNPDFKFFLSFNLIFLDVSMEIFVDLNSSSVRRRKCWSPFFFCFQLKEVQNYWQEFNVPPRQSYSNFLWRQTIFFYALMIRLNGWIINFFFNDYYRKRLLSNFTCYSISLSNVEFWEMLTFFRFDFFLLGNCQHYLKKVLQVKKTQLLSFFGCTLSLSLFPKELINFCCRPSQKSLFTQSGFLGLLTKTS